MCACDLACGGCATHASLHPRRGVRSVRNGAVGERQESTPAGRAVGQPMLMLRPSGLSCESDRMLPAVKAGVMRTPMPLLAPPLLAGAAAAAPVDAAVFVVADWAAAGAPSAPPAEVDG